MARYQPFNPEEWLHRRIDVKIGMLQLHTQLVGSLGETAVQRAGKKAQVVRADFRGEESAVKVFKRRFVGEHNVVVTAQLKRFADVPGLRVCRREVISGAVGLAEELAGLAYSIVMPWIGGTPWAAYIEEKTSLTHAQSLALARTTADVLAGLERRKLVHADISSTNVFVAKLWPAPEIELIDVEDMYHPEFVDIPFVPDGSPGYQHPRNVGQGCWNPFGDRFAASMLLAEMLAWHDPAVRARKADASLFAQEELCEPGSKFNLVRAAVAKQSAAAARLFERAWRSPGLTSCPTLADWKRAVDAATVPASRFAFPALEPTTPPLTPRLAALLSTYQTTFVDSTECVVCKRRVRHGNPSDHAPHCFHHPSNFRSLLQTRKPTFPEPAELDDILARYSYAAKKERPKFDDITFRPLTSASPPLKPKPEPAPAPPSIDFSRFPGLIGPKPTICPKCGKAITRVGGTEKGHSITCLEWWKNL